VKVFANVSSDVPGNWRDDTSFTSQPLLRSSVCSHILFFSVQGVLCRLCSQYGVVISLFLELGAAEPLVTAMEYLEFRETKRVNGGRILLTVVNLYVRIEFRVATFDTNYYVTDNTQSNAASI